MILRAEGLGVRGPHGPVLRDLTFSLEAGQILGVVGESGAGKSMVGRTIAQALPMGFAVNAGTLHYGAADLATMAKPQLRALLGRDIAFIPQEPMAALNPVMTVGQQMQEHLARLGMGNWQAKCMEMLASVHLRDPASVLLRYPHQLSGGMCQRVLIAMAFASDPKLVIADEPTTALDVTVQAQIMRVIRMMQARVGTALLFITHDLALAEDLCDDVLVLYAGRPVELGPSQRVLAAPSHPYTRSLQLAAPALAGPRRALLGLPGQMPGLSELVHLRGCRFAPRCPVVSANCHETEPSAGAVACHHPDRTAAITPPALLPVPQASETGDLLRVESLGRVFTSGGLFRRTTTRAAEGVSFTIRRGAFVGLVGESGSGKSTVARMVMGLERPSTGQIRLDGVVLAPGTSAARASRLASMQMVFQDPQSALNPRRRVADIVTQRLRAAGASEVEMRDRAQALLAQVGLAPEIATRTPAQLSGGQRQRVNIARALCVVPKLLIADEIVSGLDVSVQAQLLDLLLDLRGRLGFAMLFISHDLAVVRYLCSHVLVMRAGEVVEQGETAQVFAAPQHDYTRTLLSHGASQTRVSG